MRSRVRVRRDGTSGLVRARTKSGRKTASIAEVGARVKISRRLRLALRRTLKDRLRSIAGWLGLGETRGGEYCDGGEQETGSHDRSPLARC